MNKNNLIIGVVVTIGVAASYLVGNYVASENLSQMYASINTERSLVRIPFELKPDETIEYFYRGMVINVVDGDTCDIRLEMGFNIYCIKRFRLSGINAPEMSEPLNGEDSKEALKKIILEKNVIVVTKKDRTDKYGRFLATIFADDGQINVNEKMVQLGKAKIY